MSTVGHMNVIADRATAKPPRLRRREVVLDDDHRVGLSLCGEGVPLVLVHGIMAEGMLYARSLRRIAGLGFRVIAVDTAIEIAAKRTGRDSGAGPWAIYFGVAVDLFSDGVMIGATFNVTMRNGMIVSLIVYLATAIILQPILGLWGLWIALHLLLLVRAGIYAVAIERRKNEIFA